MTLCLLALLSGAVVAPTVINMAYCGFGGNYCGDSFNDDVYARTNNVLLSYALIAPNGAVILDTDNYPRNQVTSWKNTGKRVFLSVGGPRGEWTSVYASETNRQNFLTSLTNIVRTYGLSGVDLDIEGSFLPTPKQVATLINDLRNQLNTIGRIYLMVSADDITIYQGVAVPDPDSSQGLPFNYLVPIVQLADSSIDFYHVKAYSNWYDAYDHASLLYMQDVYLNWRNFQGFCQDCKPIPNFKGVVAAKLFMGVVASDNSRKPEEYAGPTVIRNFKSWLQTKGFDMYGFQVWNSHYDQINGNQVSAAIVN